MEYKYIFFGSRTATPFRVSLSFLYCMFGNETVLGIDSMITFTCPFLGLESAFPSSLVWLCFHGGCGRLLFTFIVDEGGSREVLFFK